MPERNLCKEAGCNAACCRDAYFGDSYHVKEVVKFFPDAKKVRDLGKAVGDGVYYTNFLGNATVRIVGPCPNLTADEKCSIYDRRPWDCSALGIGSRNCVFFRRVQEQGLKITS